MVQVLVPPRKQRQLIVNHRPDCAQRKLTYATGDPRPAKITISWGILGRSNDPIKMGTGRYRGPSATRFKLTNQNSTVHLRRIHQFLHAHGWISDDCKVRDNSEITPGGMRKAYDYKSGKEERGHMSIPSRKYQLPFLLCTLEQLPKGKLRKNPQPLSVPRTLRVQQTPNNQATSGFPPP